MDLKCKSISQGTFLSLPQGFNLSKLRRRKRRKASENESLDLWETAFTTIWQSVEEEMKDMNEKLFSKVLEKLVKHIGSIGVEQLPDGTIPCELLLTGTNLPDHKMLLDSLTIDLTTKITPHVATLWSNDSTTLKTTVQGLVKQIVKLSNLEDPDTESSDEEQELEIKKKSRKLNSGQLSMATLSAWYQENCGDKKSPIVIIIPDFETFSFSVLGDLIELLCSYEKEVPFVLVLSVATSPAAVCQSLPRAIMSRLVVQLFYSEASPTFLNHVIEKILFNDKCPFKLGPRTITFLTDVFLFHSFSVQRFIQGFKYCMMEHFYRKDYMQLCCPEEKLTVRIKEMNPIDVENIRKLASFKKHVEACELSQRKTLLLDDANTKDFIGNQLRNLHTHISDFQIVLKCLNILSRDLPGSPIGRHMRELYSRSVGSNITEDKDYKKMLSLLALQARSELLTKVASILNLLKIDNILDILSEDTNHFETVINKLEKLKNDMEQPPPETNGNVGHRDLTQELANLLSKELFEPFLVSPMSLPLHEILFFDDLPAVRRRISGDPRSAIHNALNNPCHYLECDCCQLSESDAIQASLPDLSIAYKLYLESSRTINLLDWFQAFSTVIRPDNNMTENGGVDQQMQARFTKAVSELQFLGFIKPSKSKVDHVTRNTFGNM